MKKMKKFFAVLLAAVMMLAMGVAAFAQDVNSNAGGNGTITIENASKGETYSVYKLFDASVTGTEDGSIAYTGDIPESLVAYFTKDSVGNISLKEGVDQTELVSALTDWSKTASATASAESDGSTLKFTNLAYGYYVVTTTQGAAVTVTSTNPKATIVDKNSTVPGDLVKKVDNNDINIGDTVTYTVTFKTANYDGAGKDAKRITSYIITDTLPDFLSDVSVTKITIGGAEYTVDSTIPQFSDKKITIPWVDGNGNSLYNNGAEIVITYRATVTDKAAIDSAGNTNKVTVTWTTEGNNPSKDKLEKEETIYTYAIALKKVDRKGNPLAGAEFQFPFYVKETADSDGAYIYAGTTEGTGLTDTITTPDSGVIVVKGVKTGTYEITETKAPAGYNKLIAPVKVTAVKTGKNSTKTTIYLDENGEVTDKVTETEVEVILKDISAAVVAVVNMTGSELPSTGGMGTIIFYILGAVLVVGAGVLLVVRRRMSVEK